LFKQTSYPVLRGLSLGTNTEMSVKTLILAIPHLALLNIHLQACAAHEISPSEDVAPEACEEAEGCDSGLHMLQHAALSQTRPRGMTEPSGVQEDVQKKGANCQSFFDGSCGVMIPRSLDGFKEAFKTCCHEKGGHPEKLCASLAVEMLPEQSITVTDEVADNLCAEMLALKKAHDWRWAKQSDASHLPAQNRNDKTEEIFSHSEKPTDLDGLAAAMEQRAHVVEAEQGRQSVDDTLKDKETWWERCQRRCTAAKDHCCSDPQQYADQRSYIDNQIQHYCSNGNGAYEDWEWTTCILRARTCDSKCMINLSDLSNEIPGWW